MAPALRTDIYRADDPAWEEWLDPVPRDVYHTAGFHRYASGSGEGQPQLIIVGDRHRGLAWPYLLRPVAEVPELALSDAKDVTSVYGYPGPLAWGCEPGDAFLARAWAEVRAVWKSQNAISAFTRFNPILGNASVAAGFRGDVGLEAPSALIATRGHTVSIDLGIGYDGARAAYKRDLRREIDRSREAGLVTVHDEDWAELPTFARLYDETMLRLGASDYYFFGERNFLRLRDALGSHLHLLVTRSGDAVAAAGLFTEWDGIVEWYLVGTDSAFSAQSPSKVLVDWAVGWAIERGDRILHLGGGRGGSEDSLMWFKSRFSPRQHAFHTGRWILDAERFAGLVAARGAALGAEVSVDSAYFPAYRAPVVAPASADPPRSAPVR